jgi:hypothetical protein
MLRHIWHFSRSWWLGTAISGGRTCSPSTTTLSLNKRASCWGFSISTVSPDAPTHAFDPSVYGLDIYYPGEVSEGRVRRFDKFLHFYKLHGSIHWQLREDEVRARHRDLSPFSGYRLLEAEKKAECLNTSAASLPAVGILPTANKFTQTLAMPFAHLFRILQSRLSAPQTFLLVLGYGFGDDHVTRILETALMNPSLVMLVVEPNPTSTTVARVRRYKDLGKRAFVLTAAEAAHATSPFLLATFDDFARSIMPDVQWLDDFLRLRRLEKQIQASVGAPADDAGAGAAERPSWRTLASSAILWRSRASA